jgi:hypothetical protein
MAAGDDQLGSLASPPFAQPLRLVVAFAAAQERVQVEHPNTRTDPFGDMPRAATIIQ